MDGRSSITYEVALLLLVLLLHAAILSCAPTTVTLSTPPENYQGPIAERPVVQQGDYWVYERENLTRGKTSTLSANIEFPLWIGKTWSYASGALKSGQPTTSKAGRVAVRIECTVVAFKQITVTAGSFDAFECKCQCELIATGRYEPGCGEWTIWYAPEVKNVAKIKTNSTATSMQLVQYRTSRTAIGAKINPRKASGPPKPEIGG